MAATVPISYADCLKDPDLDMEREQEAYVGKGCGSHGTELDVDRKAAVGVASGLLKLSSDGGVHARVTQGNCRS